MTWCTMRCATLSKRDFVDVDDLGAAEHRHHDRQADRGFGRGDGNHQKREDVSGVVQPRARERS